jgi:hypothetical protein
MPEYEVRPAEYEVRPAEYEVRPAEYDHEQKGVYPGGPTPDGVPPIPPIFKPFIPPGGTPPAEPAPQAPPPEASAGQG